LNPRLTLFVGSVLDNAWSSRCMELSREVNRLKSFDARSRCSHTSSRLFQCTTSSAPHAMFPVSRQSSPGGVRQVVALCDQPSYTNCDLTDDQWLQAFLPVKIGGLGVRRVSSLALIPAYLASAVSTLALQDTILMLATCSQDDTLAIYRSRWLSITIGAVLPSDEDTLPMTKQSFWDRPRLARDRQSVEDCKIDAAQKAQLFAASSPQ